MEKIVPPEKLCQNSDGNNNWWLVKTDEKLKKRFAIYKINRKETKFFLFWLKKTKLNLDFVYMSYITICYVRYFSWRMNLKFYRYHFVCKIGHFLVVFMIKTSPWSLQLGFRRCWNGTRMALNKIESVNFHWGVQIKKIPHIFGKPCRFRVICPWANSLRSWFSPLRLLVLISNTFKVIWNTSCHSIKEIEKIYLKKCMHTIIHP